MSDEPEMTQVTVAFRSTRVTRIGPLVVHPSSELREDQRWSVTTPCGGAVGKFATREGAEGYAKVLAALDGWETCVVDLPAAHQWSRDFYTKHGAAIEDARAAALQCDARLQRSLFESDE